MRIYNPLFLVDFSGRIYDMKKHKSKKVITPEESSSEATGSEGIVGMLITLHTFPIESEEDLKERKNSVEELKKQE